MRRGELAKMRELMFRTEAKAKRVAKIKNAKLAAKLGELEDEDDEEAHLEREVERARERTTLRHKDTGESDAGVRRTRRGPAARDQRHARPWREAAQAHTRPR